MCFENDLLRIILLCLTGDRSYHGCHRRNSRLPWTQLISRKFRNKWVSVGLTPYRHLRPSSICWPTTYCNTCTTSTTTITATKISAMYANSFSLDWRNALLVTIFPHRRIPLRNIPGLFRFSKLSGNLTISTWSIGYNTNPKQGTTP